MVRLRIAEGWCEDSLARLTAYATKYGKTLRVYDQVGPGDPLRLNAEEIARTRVIASRISRAEERWLLRRGETAPWADVPLAADLASADPDDPTSAYPPALELYLHFYQERPRGFSVAKLSKTLHIKRPNLYPILDSRLMRLYRRPARQHGQARPVLGRYQYWPAIRADLRYNRETGALAELRAMLTAAPNPVVREMAQLSDLRLMDICAW
jgi:hypothetical protein